MKRIISKFVFVTLVASLSYTQANAQNCWDWNKMVMSNLFENEDILRCLRTGADPNAQASGPPRWTPLHGAALENTNPDITAALLRAGANPTALTAAGKTPIDVARETGNLSIAAMLEGSLNSRGNSPASDSGAGLTAGNFGNDSGRFANDGECDDIRFVGDRGGAASTSDNYIGRDATDCRNLLNADRISWSGTAPGGGLPATAPQAQGLPAPSLSAGGGTGQAQDPSTCLQAELGEVEPLNDREGGWTTFWYTVRNRCDREIFYWATVHGVTSTGDSVEGATERGFSYVSSAGLEPNESRTVGTMWSTELGVAAGSGGRPPRPLLRGCAGYSPVLAGETDSEFSHTRCTRGYGGSEADWQRRQARWWVDLLD